MTAPVKRDRIFIANEWFAADSGETIAVNNPATREVIGTVPKGGRAETARAIDAAASALPGWRALTANERAGHMHRLHDALMDNQAALAAILTEEMGKPLAEAMGEIAHGAGFFKWFAEEARRIYGDTIPSPWADTRIVVSKHPVGVVGAITPWNFPNSMIARKLAAAMGAGCTMVIKPASQTPYSALAFGDIALEAGVPAGVVNVVTGAASEIAAEMCENPKLRKITFTGSTAIGKRLAAQASAHMKRVSMELGGNAPFLVFDDADLDAAVEGAMISKFRNSGQTCVCTNRFLVQASVYDAFAEKFATAIGGLNVGDGAEEGVTQGPLIDDSAVAKVEEHIADAVQKGGAVVAGGARHNLGGTFFQPTLLAHGADHMQIFRDETFGPVAAMFKFETEEDAIRMANDTEYGLACYAYTTDLGRAWRLNEELEYGLIGINQGLISTEVAPFGGLKASGVGKEGSKYGVEDYLDIKYTLFGGLGR